jgi:LmbE family N-acetylglucosaminyl deacetylase
MHGVRKRMRLFQLPSAPVSASPGKRRRLWAFLIALPACAALPAMLFQYFLYRENLAAAHENLPLTAPLHKADRVLIVSPHCDDETLGAGGTIAQARKLGARVQVVFMTNGDGSRSTQLVAEARALRQEANLKNLLPRRVGSTPDNTASDNTAPDNTAPDDATTKAASSKNLFQDIAAMRRREAIAACKTLGVAESDVIFLGYPDGGTRAMWEKHWAPKNAYFSPYTKTARSPYSFSKTKNASYSGAQAMRDLENIMRDFAPTVVMTTHPADTHPDHWAAFSYTSAALERLRLDENPKIRAMASRAKTRTFLVHHGFWPVPHGYHPKAVLAPPASLEKCGTRWQSELLSQTAQNAKKSALEKYTSQMVWTPHYLRSFLRRNELFGIVPVATIQNSKFKTQNSKLIEDSPSDSSWRDRWPAADIESVSCQSAPGVLRLQTQLAGAASARVHYQFSVHVITSNEVTAWTIDARRDGETLRATLQKNGDNRESSKIALSGQLAADGFAFDVLRPGPGVLPVPATLLVSASTAVGKTRLDQTPTGILRLQ